MLDRLFKHKNPVLANTSYQEGINSIGWLIGELDYPIGIAHKEDAPYRKSDGDETLSYVMSGITYYLENGEWENRYCRFKPPESERTYSLLITRCNRCNKVAQLIYANHLDTDWYEQMDIGTYTMCKKYGWKQPDNGLGTPEMMCGECWFKANQSDQTDSDEPPQNDADDNKSINHNRTISRLW